MSRVETPCIKVCRQDKAAGICEGCGRTVHEVILWTTMTDEARQEVLRALPGRLAGLAAARAQDERG